MRARRGFTLVEVLIAIFIFGILAAIVVNNFEFIKKRNALSEFTDQVYAYIQRAHTLAVTGHTVQRCSNNVNLACTQDIECGSGSTCLQGAQSILPYSWGIHYTAPVTPNPATFVTYGDREYAECGCGGFPLYQYLLCIAGGNRRYDIYGSETERCNWSCTGAITPSNSLACLTDSPVSDFLDLDPEGSLTVPPEYSIKFKRSDSVAVTFFADINFMITTGQAYVGSKASGATTVGGQLVPHKSTRDVLNTVPWRGFTTVCGNGSSGFQCYDSAAVLTTVCVSFNPSGPYNRILIYPNGVVLKAGGESPSC